MKKIDPKYINVPNICFSLTKKTDDREPEFIKQRIERGFDSSETWSLCNTIADFIIPRLEVFQEIVKDVNEPDKVFEKQIKEFLTALKLIQRDDGAWNFSDGEQAMIDKGLNSFPKIFMSLWY